jgi:anti-anti-sigma factor
MALQEAQQTAPPTVAVEFEPPGVAIVTLRGEHDLSSRPLLVDALSEASARPNVLVDLGGCAFIDSCIAHALLVADTGLRERDGRLVLVIPPEAWAVQRVAELTPLAVTMPIHETRSAGIAAFQEAVQSKQRASPPDPGGVAASERGCG